MMDRYLLRRQISVRQFDAGERLHEFWRRAGAAPLTVSNYGLRIVATGDMTEHQAALRADLKEVFHCVGPRLSSLLIHVCICDEPAGEWGERHRGKCADGIALLRLALDSVADFWGMAYDER
jgi:hypothetical protein